MSKEMVEKIESVSKKESGEELQRIAPDKEQFDAMIQQENQMPNKVAQEQQAAKPSLVQEVGQNDPNSKVSEKKVLDKLRTTTEQIEKAKDTINAAGENAKIKKSFVRPLRNHLTHVDDQIKIAQSTAGLEGQEFKEKSSTTNPLAKFFGTLDHQQQELDGIGSYIEKLSNEGEGLTADKLLLIQVKVGQVQSHLEFFLNMLNKAIESTKTVMNIQV